MSKISQNTLTTTCCIAHQNGGLQKTLPLVSLTFGILEIFRSVRLKDRIIILELNDQAHIGLTTDPLVLSDIRAVWRDDGRLAVDIPDNRHRRPEVVACEHRIFAKETIPCSGTQKGRCSQGSRFNNLAAQENDLPR